MSNDELILRVENDLKKFLGDNKLAGFKEALEKDGGVLTGSFLLRAIGGFKWSFSDIDIFLPALSSPSALKAWLDKDCESAFAMNEFSNYRDSLCNKSLKLSSKYRFRCLLQKEPDTSSYGAEFYESYFSVDIVETSFSGADLEPFIMEHFDFDMVKNTYKVVNGKSQLFVFNPEAISTLRCVFDCGDGDVIYSMNRKLKYEERGFDFDFSMKKTLRKIREQQMLTIDLSERRMIVATTFYDLGGAHRGIADVGSRCILKNKSDAFEFPNEIIEEIVDTLKDRWSMSRGKIRVISPERCHACSFTSCEFPHVHLKGSLLAADMGVICREIVVISRRYELLAWNAIVDLCVGLFPLNFPIYVLIWIAEWLPHFQIYHTNNEDALSHIRVFELVRNINETFRRRIEEDREKRRKTNI